MGLLIKQQKLLVTIDDVKKYINDVDVAKIGVVTFKMKMPNETKNETYTYIAIFDTIVKGNFGILYDPQRDKYRLGTGVFSLLAWNAKTTVENIIKTSRQFTKLRKTNPTIYNFFLTLCTTCNDVFEAIDECRYSKCKL